MEIIIKKGDTLYKLIDQIRNSPEGDVTIKGQDESKILSPQTNRSFLAEVATGYGKNLQIETETQRKSDGDPRRNPQDIKAYNIKPAQQDEEASSIKSALKIVGIFVIFCAALVAIAAFWYFVPSGQVNIILNSETLVKNIEITVDPKAVGADPTKKTIPGVELAITKSERKTTPATGKTTTGEKAKGKVTILNKTDNDKTFDSRTIFILDDNSNLKYLLTEDIKVSKRTVTSSSTTTETVTYGSAEGEIMADKIGKDYNLDIGKSFEIEDQEKTKFTASNDKEKIKGGSSEEVKAVAKEDIDKISSEMEEAIKTSLENELKGKLVGDQEIPSGGFTYAIIEQTYDKKIGDPAEVLVLDETAKAEAIVYSKNHLKEILAPIIKDTIPDRYSLFETDSELEISDAIAQKTVVSETGSKTMPLQVKVKSYIIPKIDADKIRNSLLGQSLPDADSYLLGISGISSFDLSVTPQFPGPFNSMPHVASHLKINLSHN